MAGGKEAGGKEACGKEAGGKTAGGKETGGKEAGSRDCRRQGGRRQEAGSRRQEAGGRRQEAGGKEAGSKKAGGKEAGGKEAGGNEAGSNSDGHSSQASPGSPTSKKRKQVSWATGNTDGNRDALVAEEHSEGKLRTELNLGNQRGSGGGLHAVARLAKEEEEVLSEVDVLGESGEGAGGEGSGEEGADEEGAGEEGADEAGGKGEEAAEGGCSLEDRAEKSIADRVETASETTGRAAGRAAGRALVPKLAAAEAGVASETAKQAVPRQPWPLPPRDEERGDASGRVSADAQEPAAGAGGMLSAGLLSSKWDPVRPLPDHLLWPPPLTTSLIEPHAVHTYAVVEWEYTRMWELGDNLFAAHCPTASPLPLASPPPTAA